MKAALSKEKRLNRNERKCRLTCSKMTRSTCLDRFRSSVISLRFSLLWREEGILFLFHLPQISFTLKLTDQLMLLILLVLILFLQPLGGALSLFLHQYIHIHACNCIQSLLHFMAWPLAIFYLAFFFASNESVQVT